MSITSNCPKCLKQVTIPAGVTDETVVRCPLCGAEYAGRESLSMVPPALIIVCPAPAVLSDATTAAEPVEMVAAADRQGHEDAWGGEPPTAVAGHDSADPWSRIPDEEDEADDEDDRDGIPLREEDAGDEGRYAATRDGGVAVDVGPPPKRRRRREPNLIIRFIGIALSGAMAVPAVYGIGILVYGRQFDKHNLNVLRFFTSEETTEPAPVAEADKPAKPAGDAIGFLTDDGPETKPKGATDPGVKQPPIAGKNGGKAGPGTKQKPKPGDAGEVDFSKPLEPDDPMDQPAGKDPLDLGGGGLELPKPDQPEFKPIGSIGEKPSPEGKPEAKPEPKAEPKDPGEPKVPVAKEPAAPEVKPEPKPEPQPEVKPEPKPEPKSEPKAEVKPEPKPEPKPAILGPTNRPSFAEAEVTDAVKAAQGAFGCAACSSKGTVTKDGKEEPCAVCKGKPSTDISPETYEKLRRVAEIATFAQGGAASGDIAQLAERIARSPEASQKVLDASKPLLATPAKGGILLVGTVLKVVEKGGIYGAAVKTDAAAKPVPVMLDRALSVKEGDRVLVLGSVIVEPGKNVAGYTGTQPMIVWLGLAVKQ